MTHQHLPLPCKPDIKCPLAIPCKIPSTSCVLRVLTHSLWWDSSATEAPTTLQWRLCICGKCLNERDTQTWQTNVWWYSVEYIDEQGCKKGKIWSSLNNPGCLFVHLENTGSYLKSLYTVIIPFFSLRRDPMPKVFGTKSV